MITRRHALLLSAGALAAVKLPTTANAQPVALDTDRRGMSAFGDLALPADFKHFPYANTEAPKGGAYSECISLRTYNGSFLTFNSLNTYILKGDGAFGMDYTFATLMARASDEPDAMYGLAAKSVRITDDGQTYRFTLRDALTFHDGSPMTADDVVWSLNTLKDKGHPIITQLLRDFDKAEADGDKGVIARFKAGRGREVPLSVAGMRAKVRRLVSLPGAAMSKATISEPLVTNRVFSSSARAMPLVRRLSAATCTPSLSA